MLNRIKGRRSLFFRRQRRLSGWMLAMLIGFSSFCGWGLTQIQSAAGQSAVRETIRTVDTVPPNLQLAQETYLVRCATCHIAIPPAVLPTQSWKAILQDSNHYGINWEQPRNPDLALAWKYLQTNSRPLNPDEQTPYRIARSRYFKILHPRVKFSEPARISTCATCHVGTAQFDFRTLKPEWKDAP